MPRIPLSHTRDWELVHKHQDLRGRQLLDEHGSPIGTIAEMMVDTDSECIDAVVLDDGAEYATHDLKLRGDQVLLLRPATPAADEPGLRPPEMPEASAPVLARVPVLEEELSVRKESIERGELEVGRDVVAERRAVEVPVWRDEVVVEHRPLERRPTDQPIGQTWAITIPLRAERVKLEKAPVVAEEVAVRKRAVQDLEAVSDTLRREEVVVTTPGRAEVGRVREIGRA